MTPESPLDPRQALEASLTAMLLGELPEDQAAFLRQAIASDAELAKLHARLQHTIGLVRESASTSATEPAKQPEPLRLSEERRQQLLQSFKTIVPKEFVPVPKRRARWLVPAAVAAGVLLVLSALLSPVTARVRGSRTMARQLRDSSRAGGYVAGEAGNGRLGLDPNTPAKSAESVHSAKSVPLEVHTITPGPAKVDANTIAKSYEPPLPAATPPPAPLATTSLQPELARPKSASTEDSLLALKGNAIALPASEHDKYQESLDESRTVRGNSVAQRLQAPTEPGAPLAALASATPAIVLPQSGENGRDLAWFKESGDHGTAAANEGLDLKKSGDQPGVILYEASGGRREPSQAGNRVVPPHPLLTDGESVRSLGEESELPRNGNLSGPALTGGAVSGSVAFKGMAAGPATAADPGAMPSDTVALLRAAGKPADRSLDLRELAQQLAPPATQSAQRAMDENRANEVNGDVTIARERAAETAARTKEQSGASNLGIIRGSNAYAAANQNETPASGFESAAGNWRFSQGNVGIIAGAAPGSTGAPSAPNPASGVTSYTTSGGTLITGGDGAISAANGWDGKNNKTPILGDLALLGYAFRSDQSSQALVEKLAISPSTSSSSGLGALNEGWMDSTRPRQLADTDEKKLAEGGGADAYNRFVFGFGTVRDFSGGALSTDGIQSSAAREESNRKWDSPADSVGRKDSFGAASMGGFGDGGGVGGNSGRSAGGAPASNYQWSLQAADEDKDLAKGIGSGRSNVYDLNVVGYVNGNQMQNMQVLGPLASTNSVTTRTTKLAPLEFADATTVANLINSLYSAQNSTRSAGASDFTRMGTSGGIGGLLQGVTGSGVAFGGGSGPAGARGAPAPSASTESGVAVANNEIQKQLQERITSDYAGSSGTLRAGTAPNGGKPLLAYNNAKEATAGAADVGKKQIAGFFELQNADPADAQKTLQDQFNSSTVRMQSGANASPLLANNKPITARITESQSAPTTTATPGFGISYYRGQTVDDVSSLKQLQTKNDGITTSPRSSALSGTNGVLTWRQPIALPETASSSGRTYPNSSTIGDVYFSIDPETRRISGLEAKAAVDGVAVADSPSALLTPDTLRKFEVARAEPQSGSTGSSGVILPGANKDAVRNFYDDSARMRGQSPTNGGAVLGANSPLTRRITQSTETVNSNFGSRTFPTNAPLPVPPPEVQTKDTAFSTFSLNVSDVSFKLAAASLEKGQMPDPAGIRSEEFINAFDYRDPEPAAGGPIAFAWERARYPYAQNRDLVRFSLKTAALGRQPGRPLNLVLLLDNSGSMERADRVRIIHEALRVLAAQLGPQDTLSIVLFARTPRLWVDGVPGTQAAKVAEEVRGITPQGGTNLEEAMNLAYQTALRHYLPAGVNRVVLLTDGAANLGDVDPDTLKKKVETHRQQGIALDCFGIGWEGYNDDLLEVLTRNADGRYGFINTPEEAATEFAGQLAGALHVAASDVKVQVEFNPDRVTAYRQVGYAKHQLTKEQFRDNTVNAAQIGAAESGTALYVVEINPGGEGVLATVRVRYKVPGTTEYREMAWPVPYTGNAPALEQSTPAMRLAGTASAFSEWLALSPYGADVTSDRLLRCLNGVPEIYGPDARPKRLEEMIRQTQRNPAMTAPATRTENTINKTGF
jgi:Mg-chelatase subunit ChlD